jgi:fructooligosaccharide transport system substrate-binding protein
VVSVVGTVRVVALVVVIALGMSGWGVATALAAPPRTLTFWHACSVPHVNKALKDRAESFGKHVANVRIVVECFPFREYFQKITTATAGGNAPDVFWVDFPLIADYVYRKTIIPLDQFVTKEDLADYYPTPRDNMERGGQIWALPMHQSTEALVYNAALVEQAGVTVPRSLKEQWTWQQFLAAAQQLTKTSGGRTEVWGYTTHYDPDLYSVQPWIAQHGGAILSPDGTKASGYLNGPATVEAMTFWGELFWKHRVSPVDRIPDIFQTGRVALYQANPFVLRDIQQRYPALRFGVTFLPKDKQCAVPSGAWHIGIHRQARDQRLAWQFVDWVAGREGHKIWIETTGYMPARRSAYQALAFVKQAPWNIFWEGLITCAVVRPKTPAYNFLQDTFYDIIKDIQLGRSATEVLDAAARKVDGELAKYR